MWWLYSSRFRSLVLTNTLTSGLLSEDTGLITCWLCWTGYFCWTSVLLVPKMKVSEFDFKWQLYVLQETSHTSALYVRAKWIFTQCQAQNWEIWKMQLPMLWAKETSRNCFQNRANDVAENFHFCPTEDSGLHA